jgi:hypothetical protein
MKQVRIFTWRLLIFMILTLASQVGGLIYLLNFGLFAVIKKLFDLKRGFFLWRNLSFVCLYGVICTTVVPAFAARFGRVPLPFSIQNGLQPANKFTCVLNRHYVKPELLGIATGIAHGVQVHTGGRVTNYLEANFPFINGYPLWPHLSHNDGKKLDLAFYYVDARSQIPLNTVPAWLGYGICEEPQRGERDRPAECGRQGYWQYSWVKSITPQQNKSKYMFDANATQKMLTLCGQQKGIGRILLEPHLKNRLNLTSEKFGLHGCQAVRHDDHVHIQLSN